MNFTKYFLTYTFFTAAFATTANANVSGIYKMDVKIDDKTFEDLVVLNQNQDLTLTGSVTVPGNFTANIVSGKRGITWSGFDPIEFSIIAIERGKEIKVTYLGRVQPQSGPESTACPQISGRLLDTDTREEFGDFHAVRLLPDGTKDCRGL